MSFISDQSEAEITSIIKSIVNNSCNTEPKESIVNNTCTTTEPEESIVNIINNFINPFDKTSRWLYGLIKFYPCLREIIRFKSIINLIETITIPTHTTSIKMGSTTVLLCPKEYILIKTMSKKNYPLLINIKKGSLRTTMLEIYEGEKHQILPSEVVKLYHTGEEFWDLCMFRPESLPLLLRKQSGCFIGSSWLKKFMTRCMFEWIIDNIAKSIVFPPGTQYIEFSFRNYRQIRFGTTEYSGGFNGHQKKNKFSQFIKQQATNLPTSGNNNLNRWERWERWERCCKPVHKRWDSLGILKDIKI